MRCRIPDGAGFWCTAPLLAVSIAWEGIVHHAWLLGVWPWVRGRERARVARLLRRRVLPQALSLGLALGLLAGCQTSGSAGAGRERPFDTGTSFSFQIRELGWTFQELLFSDSLEDSRRFLQEDLSALFDPELDQLGETFSLLGW